MLTSTSFENHIDTLFRITHSATFNVSVQALVLIQKVTTSEKVSRKCLSYVASHSYRTLQTVTERFYRALYESLLDPRLATSSKQAMYLNLLFKAVKSSTLPQRTCAFVKRILQVLGIQQPPFICGALYLLGEVSDCSPCYWTSSLCVH